MNKEIINLLEQAKAEIQQLRSSNSIMATRLDMFDKMMLLFNTEPAFPRQGMTEDIAWKIDKAIEAEKQKIEKLQNTQA